MWGKFSIKARQALFFAQEESFLQQVQGVDPLHILMGILRDETCNCVRVLSHSGISTAKVIEVSRKEMPLGKQKYLGETILTPRAKKAIDDAFAASRQLGCSQLRTEHLLIGLMMSKRSRPERILTKLGLTATMIASAIMELSDLEENQR